MSSKPKLYPLLPGSPNTMVIRLILDVSPLGVVALMPSRPKLELVTAFNVLRHMYDHMPPFFGVW